MKKQRLKKVSTHLTEKLKDKEFKRLYEIERAKVSLAQKISELRQAKKIRQVDLARKLNVSQQFISQIETGEASNLSLDTLLKLARSLSQEIEIHFRKRTKRGALLKIT